MPSKQRVVCWFSRGVASAVVSKLAIEKYKDNPDYELHVVTIFLENEHPDGIRFQKEVEAWLGHPIATIQDTKFNANIDQVFEKLRWVNGIYGASCTTRLKKHVRHTFQRDTDIHVFGMCAGEERRILQLLDKEPALLQDPLLIEAGLTKDDCFRIIQEAGIAFPIMYHQGYPNNNCVGCVKATSVAYWNKIRADYPEVFEKRSWQEKEYGFTLCTMSEKKFLRLYPDYHAAIIQEENETGKPILKTKKNGQAYIPLRFLPPEAGKDREIKLNSCGFFCDSEESRKNLFEE